MHEQRWEARAMQKDDSADPRQAFDQSPLGRGGPPDLLFNPVRTRVFGQLAKPGTRAKVISLIAPTGSGKTAVMSQLYGELVDHPGQHCWIGLDKHDTSLESLVYALRCAVSDAATRDGANECSAGTGSLVTELGLSSEPITVFIDGLDSCTDPRLGSFLDSLIFQTPVPLSCGSWMPAAGRAK